MFKEWLKLQENNQLEQLRKTLNALMEKDQTFQNPIERKNLLKQAWAFILKNMNAILADMEPQGNGNYPAASYAATILVIHMDATPQNQKFFLQKLPSNHIKYKGLQLRSNLNEKIMEFAKQNLYGCNDPRFHGDPCSGVRDANLFPNKINGSYPRSKAEAEQLAHDTGNTCILAAAKAVGGGISYTS